MLPEVSITKMIHSLSTGNAADRGHGVDLLRRVLEQALHLGGERLVRGDELLSRRCW